MDRLTRDSFGEIDAPQEEVQALASELTAFEHPTKHNPGTLDCVSCHLAQTVLSFSYKQYPQFGLEDIFNKERYRNPVFNLENRSPKQGQTNIVRMFGYFESDPIVTQRTINESAEVAKSLMGISVLE